MISPPLEQHLVSYVEHQSARLVQIVSDLVRLPLENTPPVGNEHACQTYISNLLRELNWDGLLYFLDDVPGLHQHPLFFAGRDYRNRPNVGARLPGRGNGRSLLLSGHIDMVPKGSLPWTRDPFGAKIEGNLLFGRRQ